MEIIATLLKHGADLTATNNVKFKANICDADALMRSELQAGITALKKLAVRFTSSDEIQLLESIHVAQMVVAVKTGDVAELQRYIGLNKMDVNASDHVSKDCVERVHNQVVQFA